MEETITDEQLVGALQKCRDNPFVFEPFAQLHSFIDWGGLGQRKRNLRLGIIDLAFDWLRNPQLTDVIYRDCLWDWLQAFVIIDDLDYLEELSPIRAFVERGGIELAVAELERQDCMFPATLLSVLSWCCMVQDYIPRISCTGAHFIAMEFIQNDADETNAEISMSLLRALTGKRCIRAGLMADGLLDVVLVYLKDLVVSKEDVRLRRAFRASSVICRLSECDTSGRGESIINDNPDIIKVTLSIFHRVLEAGPTGTVLNMSIDPHLITMDLLFLAKIPRFRTHFFAKNDSVSSSSAVEIFTKALTLRGHCNASMTSDIVHILLLMLQDEKFRTEMQQSPNREELSRRLTTIVGSEDFYGKDTCARAKTLQESVDVNTFLTRNLSPPPKMPKSQFPTRWRTPKTKNAASPEKSGGTSSDLSKAASSLLENEEVTANGEESDDGNEQQVITEMNGEQMPSPISRVGEDENVKNGHSFLVKRREIHSSVRDSVDDDDNNNGDEDEDDDGSSSDHGDDSHDDEEGDYDSDEAHEQPAPLYIHTPMRPNATPSYLAGGTRRKSATTMSSLSIVSVSSADHNFDEVDISSMEESIDSAAERGDDTDAESSPALFRRPYPYLQLQRGTSNSSIRSNGSIRSSGGSTPIPATAFASSSAERPSTPTPPRPSELGNTGAVVPVNPSIPNVASSASMMEVEMDAAQNLSSTATQIRKPEFSSPSISPSPSSSYLSNLPLHISDTSKSGSSTTGGLESQTKLLIAAIVVLGFSMIARYIQ